MPGLQSGSGAKRPEAGVKKKPVHKEGTPVLLACACLVGCWIVGVTFNQGLHAASLHVKALKPDTLEKQNHKTSNPIVREIEIVMKERKKERKNTERKD